MAYPIATTGVILSVLEGHSPIASLFKCDIFAPVFIFFLFMTYFYCYVYV